jgi:cytochrome c
MRLTSIVVAIAALAAGAAHAADGAATFQTKCGACHGPDGSGGEAAPALTGIVGRKIAGVEGFDYSPALKAKPGKWTAQSLGAYLAAPQTFAPGTKMYISLTDPAEQAAVVAYLAGLK